MVEIPDQLECLFTASVEEDEGSYSIEIPREELDMGRVSAGETYRVVILDEPQPRSESQPAEPSATAVTSSPSTPPVSSGDIREVTIETLGDQGDGIAKVERGYVLIVPEARPEDEVTVEITDVRENFAFTRVQNDSDSSPDR
ncbi:TRAM domain-containing protein [Halococcus sediminicola]|uniref:TRAM domain-containing protein n=1 Tax=Halococcus sediminicola TaxID=1264579 RepID=UPI000679B24A|nr:TRAM domain-containing protein [Halococcus sediminicola]